MTAIEKSGHSGKIVLGMDVAASEFFVPESKTYDLEFKSEDANKVHSSLSGDSLMELYQSFVSKYPIESIEDPFDQDDWAAYSKMTSLLGEKV